MVYLPTLQRNKTILIVRTQYAVLVRSDNIVIISSKESDKYSQDSYVQLKRYEQRINLYQFNRLFVQEYDCMALFLIQLLSILCNFFAFFLCVLSLTNKQNVKLLCADTAVM